MEKSVLDELNYVECIKLQLSEIEMLQSMFPDESEFCIENGCGVQELQSFIARHPPPSILPSARLEFSIHLHLEKGHLSLYAALPSGYPIEYPDVYVRSNQLSRQNQCDLNSQLNVFLNSVGKGDLLMGSAILWLQEHAEGYFTQDTKVEAKAEEPLREELVFKRLWIYCHHIYSKVKRKDIKDLAEEFQLTGFCLPGKPGILCVEGLSKNVIDWWHTVRSWNWQKILCKRQEEEKMKTFEDMLKFRRFLDFIELGSDSNIRIKSGGFHVEMGDLYHYLEEHQSGYMFEEYFGVSGK